MRETICDALALLAILGALAFLLVTSCRPVQAGPVFGYDAARLGDAARDATERAAEPYKVDVRIRPKKQRPLFRWHQATSWACR